MSYDIKCFYLAVDFLDDHPAIQSDSNAKKLAQEIQTTIEEWIEEAEQSQEGTK